MLIKGESHQLRCSIVPATVYNPRQHGRSHQRRDNELHSSQSCRYEHVPNYLLHDICLSAVRRAVLPTRRVRTPIDWCLMERASSSLLELSVSSHRQLCLLFHFLHLFSLKYNRAVRLWWCFKSLRMRRIEEQRRGVGWGCFTQRGDPFMIPSMRQCQVQMISQ